MIDLNSLQVRLVAWQIYNFGRCQDRGDLILGMTEELGELSHVFLKRKQGIRGYGFNPETTDKIVDAVCDVIVFGIHLLSEEHVKIEEALSKTFDEVLARDWRKDPNGNTSSQHKEAPDATE